MEKKRPQLNLDELHQLRWLLGGTLTLISVWTVFYLEIDAWALMVVTTILAGACLLRPTLPAHISGFIHVLAFPVVLAFFFADLWLKQEVLPAIVRLDILLLLYRGVSYRQRREDLQIIVLGLFLVVVAGVLTVSLVFAVQILAFAACALALLLVLTLIQAAEHGGPGGTNAPFERTTPSWTRVSWPRLYRRVRQATDWRVVVLGGILFAGLVTVSALLFFSLPRFQLQNSLFLERFIVRKARTGFSDSIKYNEVIDIQQDTSVALSVDVSDHSRMPSSPYWRMLVLDRYEDGTFKTALGLSGEITESELRGSQRWRSGEPVYWTFYLEAGVSRYLPLLGPFDELRFHERQVFRTSPQLGLVALRDEPVTMTAYRIEGFDSSGKLPDPEFARHWREASAKGHTLQQTALSLSAADRMDLSRIADDILAHNRSVSAADAAPAVAGRSVSALEFSDRAGLWLRLHHGYSLSPKIPHGPGKDPLVRWLASENPGHCELFAGSLVLLARAAGYPARVVTGFKGGTWNTYSNNLTLRNSDAHAWAEIFDEASGVWIRADALAEPAPAQNTQVAESQVRAAHFDRGWLARLESLRVFWYRRIVNFDQHTQVETLQAMKEATENTGVYLRGLWTGLAVPAKAWLAGPWDARRIGGFVTAILAGVAGVWGWREFGRGAWRHWWHRAIGSGREDPVRADASRWLAKLTSLERRTEESAAVTGELQRLRFGARVTWPPPEPVFRRARHALRSARRRRRE